MPNQNNKEKGYDEGYRDAMAGKSAAMSRAYKAEKAWMESLSDIDKLDEKIKQLESIVDRHKLTNKAPSNADLEAYKEVEIVKELDKVTTTSPVSPWDLVDKLTNEIKTLNDKQAQTEAMLRTMIDSLHDARGHVIWAGSLLRQIYEEQALLHERCTVGQQVDICYVSNSSFCWVRNYEIVMLGRHGQKIPEAFEQARKALNDKDRILGLICEG
jgi:hypothetical protein